MSLTRRLAHAAIPILHRAGNAPPCRRWPNRARRLLLPRLDRLARGRWNRPLVRDKTNADREHVADVDATLCDLDQGLAEAGFSRAVVSTLKYHTRGVGRSYEIATWAYHDSAGYQTHVYLFDAGRYVQVYAHCEPSYLADPEGHEGGASQRAGPCGTRLAAVLDRL